MKKLWLLLLALPLAACETPQQISQLRHRQFAAAQHACDNPNTPLAVRYGCHSLQCINAYLSHYGVYADQNPDGSLHVSIYQQQHLPM